MKLVTTALAITLAGFSYAAQAQEITGAGSTFAAPIYGKWAEAAQGVLGVKLNYQAIGSGAGINQINNRTVDFGASDMLTQVAVTTQRAPATAAPGRFQ